MTSTHSRRRTWGIVWVLQHRVISWENLERTPELGTWVPEMMAWTCWETDGNTDEEPLNKGCGWHCSNFTQHTQNTQNTQKHTKHTKTHKTHKTHKTQHKTHYTTPQHNTQNTLHHNTTITPQPHYHHSHHIRTQNTMPQHKTQHKRIEICTQDLWQVVRTAGQSETSKLDSMSNTSTLGRRLK